MNNRAQEKSRQSEMHLDSHSQTYLNVLENNDEDFNQRMVTAPSNLGAENNTSMRSINSYQQERMQR